MILIISIIICVIVWRWENKQNAKKAAAAQFTCARHMTIIGESINLFSTTTNAKTFFGRYSDAIYYAKQVLSSASTPDMRRDAKEFLDSLIEGKEELIDSFLLRCFDANKLHSQKTLILSHQHEMTSGNLEFFNDLLAGRVK